MTAHDSKLTLHVSPDGSDANTGTADAPLATAYGAVEAMRRRLAEGLAGVSSIVVEFAAGDYEMTRPISLSGDALGADAPAIMFRAADGAVVRLIGGRAVTRFEPVSDDAVLERLDEAARPHVVQADLKALGIDDLGSVAKLGTRLELFFDGEAMSLARWPNEGFVTVAGVLGEDPFKSHGIDGDHVGKIQYDGNRPERWVEEQALHLHGYWFWDWSDSCDEVAAIDAQQRVITMREPYHGYGYRPGQRYYATNALSELDVPGEWYCDRERGVLYFYPPSPIESASRPAVVSVSPSLFELHGVSNVAFEGLHLEATRAAAIDADDCDALHVTACTIENVGTSAVLVKGGSDCVVEGCDIRQTGAHAIAMSGGDRHKLIPCNHVARNNHIKQFGRVKRTYSPAVLVNGVGVTVSHNLFHDAAHDAIQLMGNNHVVECNEVHSVCYETGDVGAFYTGRDWTCRGTVIRHNYFHDISGPGLHGAMAVYLDDAASGFSIVSNLFVRAGRAAFIGGGRDNLVENNLFVDCEASVHVDARGLNWMSYHVQADGIMQERLRAMPIDSDIWRAQYPELVNILEDEPGAPKGNIIRRNVSWKGNWLSLGREAEPYPVFEDNLIDVDPNLVDEAGGDFRLRDDSPAFEIGFEPLPLDEIGPMNDGTRASWPIVHEVRPSIGKQDDSVMDS